MNSDEKRNILYGYAMDYLNSIGQGRLYDDNGLISSIGVYANKFLMFLALTYSKEEYLSIFSIDIEVTEDERIDFINKEYRKISKSKETNTQLGKKILIHSELYYMKKYLMEEKNINLDEIGRNFNIR